jgi:hypothetical protein
MRRTETELTGPGSRVPDRVRPSAVRAAAAARLVGAPDSHEDVAARMRHAARRSAEVTARTASPAATPTTTPTTTPRTTPRTSPKAALLTPSRSAAKAGTASAPAAPAAVPRAFALGPTPAEAPTPARTPSVPAVETRTQAALALAPTPGNHPDKEAEARPRHLRVVEPGLTPAQRRRRARAALIGGIGLAAFVGLALVYFHVILAQRQFAIDHLNSQVAQAQRAYQSERLQVAQLSSPQHIISQAEGQLGMVQPSNVSYLTPSVSTTASAPSSTIAALGATGATGATGGSSLLRASQAPSGDANWPTIKSQLAGQP